MTRPTLADVRAGAERAYQRWRQWKRELEGVPSAFDLLADRDALWVQLERVINERKKLRAERDEAQVELERVRAGVPGMVAHVEQQLRAARELRDEACSERDSLVIERDKALKRWDDLQLVFSAPNPVSAAPKDGTLVWCLIPARWDDTRQAFIDRANVWVADDHMGEDIVTWLPRKDDY